MPRKNSIVFRSNYLMLNLITGNEKKPTDKMTNDTFEIEHKVEITNGEEKSNKFVICKYTGGGVAILNVSRNEMQKFIDDLQKAYKKSNPELLK